GRREGDLPRVLVGLTSGQGGLDASDVVQRTPQEDAAHLPGPCRVDVAGDDLENAGLDQGEAHHFGPPLVGVRKCSPTLRPSVGGPSPWSVRTSQSLAGRAGRNVPS